jgi:hypothetical protein
LATSIALNDWGFLDTGMEYQAPRGAEAARALVELGKGAIPYLRPMLDDSRQITVFGSEAATNAKVQQHRRCDYAYALITWLLGRPEKLPLEVSARDVQILRMKEELRGTQGPSGVDRNRQHTDRRYFPPSSTSGTNLAEVSKNQCDGGERELVAILKEPWKD